MVVVVTDVNEVDVDRILRLFPFDFTHRADVGVLPVTGDLVVLRRRKSSGCPVDDVAPKRNLSLRVDVEKIVRRAVEVKLPRVGLVAHRDRGRRAIHVPPCAPFVLPCHFVGTQASQPRRGHHGGVRIVRLHPATARIVLHDLLQTHRLVFCPLGVKAVVIVVQKREVAHFVKILPSTHDGPFVSRHFKHGFFKRRIAVDDLLRGAGILKVPLGRG